VSEQSATPAPLVEMLSIGVFQEELRRAAPFRTGPPVGDPLVAAISKIEQNPAFTESRLLTRLLAALTYQAGDFRRSEIAAFDSKTLSMVVALLDVHVAGTTARDEWIGAVDRAHAAELAVGG
jgi:hypothetical protein